MRKFGIVYLALAALALPLCAVDTKSWIENEQADFEKGTIKRLSLRSDGRLSLAPTMRELSDPSSAYLWTVVSDGKGNLYAGGAGGGNGKTKLLQISAAGKTSTLCELEGLEIHALALNKAGEVFAATSPDSKIYKVDRAGKSALFYDPKAKYVWSMAFDSKGNLFIATGDQGEIHRVSPSGQGSVFFKTDETHARSMTIDSQDQLIVGTEPSGLVMRITPAGEGFVLYETAKREVTAVAVDAQGAIYAASVGNKATGGASSGPLVVPAAPAPAPNTPAGAPASLPRPAASPGGPASSFLVGGPSVPGGTELYRIEKDGYTRKVWTQSQEIAYALAFDADGRPIVGTGNRGNIYRVEPNGLSTLLVSATPTQVTGFATGAGGKLFVTTGNIGKVYQLGPDLETQGTLDSDVFDTGNFTYWGRLSFRGDTNSGKLTFETRSGNLDRPQKNWSAWAPVAITGDGGRTTSPSARFVQYRVTLNGGSGISPTLEAIELAYLPKNVAPRVDAVEATPPNYKFPAPVAMLLTAANTLSLPPIGQRRRTPAASASTDTSPGMNYAKGIIGARWSASDENNDTLLFKLEIRGEKEKEYKLLKDGLRERYYSWDSTAFPDGEYRVRVTASDAGDNPAGAGLSSQRESEVFTIDNTAPQITGLTGAVSGNQVTAKWHAKDNGSTLDKAEYSLNGSEWKLVEPTTKITDSQEHDYALTVDRVGSGEQTLAIRVSDEFDNQAVQKVVAR